MRTSRHNLTYHIYFQVLTAHDLEEQQREAVASEEIVKAKGRDPYGEAAAQQRLLREFR